MARRVKKKRRTVKISHEILEQIGQLSLMNNAFMNLALEENLGCVEEILRVILGKSDLIVKTAQTQRMLQGFLSNEGLGARRISKDILALIWDKVFNVRIGTVASLVFAVCFEAARKLRQSVGLHHSHYRNMRVYRSHSLPPCS